ncbi:O-antigen polymerase [Flavobacterium sp. LB2P84]|uniref:O-antigen polymerase n=1 Tax=Flavobacterium yafengii TaxID=3041253 RepID=UPI0024A7D6FE|nr:O-antigen polymerase [Flavobacterium yafengii]MDI6034447.1 O-antigen polymerase [Flavobacterium yafengii]
MKKAIIAILLYILILHVFIPCIYYCFYDFIPIYSDLIDYPSLIKAGLLISVPLLISVFLLKFFPSKDDLIKPDIEGKPINFLFYFAILLKLITFYFTGGYEGVLSGESNGTLLNYVFLFLNPFTLLLVLLFVQKKKSNVIKSILFYVIFITLSGSRSGVISIFFVFFIGLAFEGFKQYRLKIYKFLKYGIIIAPFLFIYATISRGLDEVVGLDFILNQIVGRMSTLETSMLPLYYDRHNLDLSLFYLKYDLWHQLKLSIDAILPGQIFDLDVMPNNYYRAMFTGYSESFVFDNYMSVNLTLPVYLYLKYSYFAIPFTVFYVIGFYKILCIFKYKPLVAIVFLSTFYNLIYFFDWVMVFTQLYSSFLTILFIKAFIPSFKIFKQLIKPIKNYESTS